ncbi:mevalonate kinase [Methanonatronarchaeum sp. AMET6-2]|uniref:mevalonate kinase n=1 Tax=Methanonatronarchaeum sp. AMET6-2 TaxID=2933293 RepID=UPI001200A541|nr:mevalonate kinase [Methanonatronarchaeum sp. AMET6-2]RZN61890.1 MAG: mevalonate kinase [Methanonatronarchaeia archaeon]UOY10620.1 mevalonate kinase [Methanonatronarchaeum sp. AMET6-2]
MISYSAPGKVYLYGEHAVVFGEPAVAAAIDRRVFTSVEERNDDIINIYSEDLPLRDISVRINSKGDAEVVGGEKTLAPLRYILEAIDFVSDKAGEELGFNLKIESELPLGGGLGSSAAVTVSTIACLSELHGLNLQEREIADIGYMVEKKVQKRASPCDTFTSSMGGVTWVETGKSLERKKPVEIPLVIGFTGKAGSTQKMVARVNELKKDYTEVVGPIIKSIGDITRTGIDAVEKEKLDELGRLMNINHGLLMALGVGNMDLSRIVDASRTAGAVGAKITGAGGGGCAVAVGENQKKISTAIEANGYEAFITNITENGVSRE